MLVATELKANLFSIYAMNGFHKVVYGCLSSCVSVFPFSAGLVHVNLDCSARLSSIADKDDPQHSWCYCLQPQGN